MFPIGCCSIGDGAVNVLRILDLFFSFCFDDLLIEFWLIAHCLERSDVILLNYCRRSLLFCNPQGQSSREDIGLVVEENVLIRLEGHEELSGIEAPFSARSMSPYCNL